MALFGIAFLFCPLAFIPRGHISLNLDCHCWTYNTLSDCAFIWSELTGTGIKERESRRCRKCSAASRVAFRRNQTGSSQEKKSTDSPSLSFNRWSSRLFVLGKCWSHLFWQAVMKVKHHSHFHHKLVCRSSLFLPGLTKASSDEQKENRSLNSLDAALVASYVLQNWFWSYLTCL